MKINPITVSKIYTSNTMGAGYAAIKPSSEEKSSAAKVDTISISAEGIKKNDNSRLAKSIASDVMKETKPETIDQLKNQITNKQYYIPTEKLASSILGYAEF